MVFLLFKRMEPSVSYLKAVSKNPPWSSVTLPLLTCRWVRKSWWPSEHAALLQHREAPVWKGPSKIRKASAPTPSVVNTSTQYNSAAYSWSAQGLPCSQGHACHHLSNGKAQHRLTPAQSHTSALGCKNFRFSSQMPGMRFKPTTQPLGDNIRLQ